MKKNMKRCGSCTHQPVCLPFRKIEEIILEEECFTLAGSLGARIYETLASICNEYDPAEYLIDENTYKKV